jgi:hypothetical protein
VIRFTWGWSPDGRRQLLAIPDGIPVDPPLEPGEVEIDLREPLEVTIDGVALAAILEQESYADVSCQLDMILENSPSSRARTAHVSARATEVDGSWPP